MANTGGPRTQRTPAERTGSFLLAAVEHLPIVATILLATFLAVYSSRETVDEKELMQWVVIILALIGTSLLVDRFFRLRRIDASIRRVDGQLTAYLLKRARATDFFLESLPPLAGEVQSSTEMALVGVNLQAFVVEYKNVILQRVQEGARVRVLAVDPQSAAAKRIANPEMELPVEYIEATARMTRHALAWINSERQGSGSVELRYVDYVPMFSAYGFNLSSHHGRIAIGLYRQFWSHVARPHMVLTRQDDGYWYEYFAAQVEEAWHQGAEVPLDLASLPRAEPSPSGGAGE
jgi:hypothetical protein